MSKDILEPIKFLCFAQLVQEIAKNSKPKSIAERKAAGKEQAKACFPALDVFRKFSRDMQAGPLAPGTTSIIFRFLFPEEDHKRKFALRNKSLIRDIADSLNLNEESFGEQERFAGCTGDQVQKLFDKRSSLDKTYCGILDIFEVDALLDQLASSSPWSHSDYSKKTLSRNSTKFLLTRKDILKTLYRQMSPYEAAVLTQIILKDLRGLLYPQVERDPTAALKDYNTKAVRILTKENAMFAWDPSNKMNRSYRAMWDVDAAAKVFEGGEEVGPRIGTQIGVPKSQKGRSCKHALAFFSDSSQVWAETKYDGERAQIHVQVVPSQKPRITIFSKSKRDSTNDRRAVHTIILDCLGLNGRPGVKARIESSVILDAEMVPCEGEKILEFWRIRRLIRETAVGVRGRGISKWSREEEGDQSDGYASESSLVSNAEGQHLGLVFFDVMYLDHDSLIQTPYGRRREILEKLILQKPGRAMLADRWLITLDELSQGSPSDFDEDYSGDDDGVAHGDEEGGIARRTLHTIFARRIAFGEEGLVLKAADSEYNEFKKPWVKLKKDYIEGLGDNVDLVLLGAACVPDRALELRVPPTTMTTFYIGAQTNQEETANNPESLPNFYIYFTAAYGLSRAELEELNFLIRNDDPIRCSAKQLPRDRPKYTYTMYPKLARPDLMLREPMAVELYGDRFTVSEGSKEYELRWPRITKYFRRHERTWSECLSIQNLRRQAREAMGRVAAKEVVRKEAETTFKHPDLRTEDVLISHRPDGMHKRVEMWRAKIAEADRPKRSRPETNKGQGRSSSKQVVSEKPKKRKRSLDDEIEGSSCKRVDNSDDKTIPNNLLGWCNTSRQSIPLLEVSRKTICIGKHAVEDDDDDNILPFDVQSISYSTRHSALVTVPKNSSNFGLFSLEQSLHKKGGAPLRAATNMIQSTSFDVPFHSTSESASTRDENSQPSDTHPSPPTLTNTNFADPGADAEIPHTKRRQYPSHPTSLIRSQQASYQDDRTPPTNFVDPFFKDALFWVPFLKERQPSLPSIRSIVESGTRATGLDAFFGACRWNPRMYNPVEPPPARGIVFVDLEDEWGPRWKRDVLDGIERLESQWRYTDEPRAPIWIFNRRTVFEAGNDVRSQALHFFG